jgi:hypothetical protein
MPASGGGRVRAIAAQLLEPAQALQRPLGRIGPALQVDGEHRDVLPQAQEQQPLGRGRQLLGHVGAQIGDLGAGNLAVLVDDVLDQGLAVPDGHGQRVRVLGLFGQPGLVAPALAGAVERIAGEDVGDDRESHGESVASATKSRHRSAPNLALSVLHPSRVSRDIGLGDR